MYIKLTALALALFLFSCNNDEKDTDEIKTETTTNGADSGGDVEAQKEALNKQSRACIALMNSLEEEMNAANAAGNAEAASALRARIDSAATENAKIGQQLMALEK
jgi:hypothetical protein